MVAGIWSVLFTIISLSLALCLAHSRHSISILHRRGLYKEGPSRKPWQTSIERSLIKGLLTEVWKRVEKPQGTVQ